MKRSAVGPAIAVLLLLGALLLVQRLQRGTGSADSEYAAADFTLPDLQGNTVQLSALRGKVVFLNLWATWCPPCRAEMPSMEVLYQRFRDRDFAMLAVAEDSDGATSVAPFVRDMKLSFPILLDSDNHLPGRYGVTGYPETFIIDRSGNVAKHVIGPEDWTRPEMIAFIEALLRQPAGT
ncbi:MAG: TlpA disulfide reductase family protein [Deltaproteobacteria bacterium]|nr:TlpA disulfide reductase family protein [Deltaproteobacteria bacterium]